MITRRGSAVKARLAGELRGRIKAKVEETSLRQVAKLLEVSHNALFKLIHDKPMRVSTLRRIEGALGRMEGYQTATRLNLDLERLLGGLGKRRRNAVKRRVMKVIAEGFEQAGLELPEWLEQLERG